jgi:pimeloyl-ACP methyl ester carboxylesterase
MPAALHVEDEEGSADGPLVVFVHGVLDRGASFRRVTALLHDECRMVLYDRRGYARSVHAGEAPTFEGHADDLLAILDGRRAVVVGHSFGGVSVLAAALRAPELFRAVVLYETGMAWAPGWDDTHLAPLLRSEDAAEQGLRMFFGDRVEAFTAEERAVRLLESHAFVVEEASVRHGRPPFDVSQLRVPLIYAHGENVRFEVPAAHVRDVVPDCEIVEVAGAGHNAHRSHPAEFADLVRRGLRRAT